MTDKEYNERKLGRFLVAYVPRRILNEPALVDRLIRALEYSSLPEVMDAVTDAIRPQHDAFEGNDQ